VWSTTNLTAQLHLPGLFNDNMVLQQQQAVSIWGTDKPGTLIKVSGSWGKTASVKTDANGSWKLKLQTPVAGGPYQLSVTGSTKLLFKNVLIGEVWFCSGQSNMQMPLMGNLNQPVIGSNEAILNAANDQIRYFHTPHTTSLTPLNDVNNSWLTAAPDVAGSFSAVAYFFARKLQTQLKVPVGIIESSWGASAIESWMDKETVLPFHKSIPDTLPQVQAQKVPTIMYNAMLHPIIGFTIKGVLWYQGETNRDNADEYQALFTAMIQSWRHQWQQGDFPFYFVQIAPFEPGKTNSAYLREAQLKTMLTVKNTGMVVTMDIGEQNVIHPSQKEQIGTRLAYWALNKDYNVKGISCNGPVYRQMEITKDHKIILSLEGCDRGLTSFGKPLTGFEIAAADKVFYPAEAEIVNDKTGKIRVWNNLVKEPVSVRYAFKSWAIGSLFNVEGLPASSFRTDDW
jgi:sialate O-acetylesterase